MKKLVVSLLTVVFLSATVTAALAETKISVAAASVCIEESEAIQTTGDVSVAKVAETGIIGKQYPTLVSRVFSAIKSYALAAGDKVSLIGTFLKPGKQTKAMVTTVPDMHARPWVKHLLKDWSGRSGNLYR